MFIATIDDDEARLLSDTPVYRAGPRRRPLAVAFDGNASIANAFAAWVKQQRHLDKSASRFVADALRWLRDEWSLAWGRCEAELDEQSRAVSIVLASRDGLEKPFLLLLERGGGEFQHTIKRTVGDVIRSTSSTDGSKMEYSASV